MADLHFAIAFCHSLCSKSSVRRAIACYACLACTMKDCSQRRSAPPPGGMLASASGSATAAAPAPGEDLPCHRTTPSHSSCPSCPPASGDSNSPWTCNPTRTSSPDEPGHLSQHLLRIAHVNINSITAPNRLDELHHFTQTNNIHILALSETKLDDSIHPSLYTLDNFHSPLTHHRNRHGGGTAIYAHKSLAVTQLELLQLEDREDWVWCKISISKFTLLICCLYLPPNLDANRLDQFTDHFSESTSLANAYPTTTKIVLGDFNAGNNYLTNPTHIQKSNGTSTFDTILADTAETLGLTQIIKEPTRITNQCANLRDLIFISDTSQLTSSGTLSSFSRLDHFPIFVELRIKAPEIKKLTKTVWDYNNIDRDLFISKLQQTDWDEITDNNIHTAVSNFSDAILSAAKTAIPTKTLRSRSADKPWVNCELKRNIRKRDTLFRHAKKTGSDFDWHKWRQQRNLVTKLNKYLHSQFILSQVNKLVNKKQNPQAYFQTLGNLTGRKHAQPIPPLVKPDGETVTDDKDKALLLNDYFASQTQLDLSTEQTLPNLHARSVPALDTIQVNEREVLSLINSLDPNKSTGPDEIPTKWLKFAAVLISEPMTKLFNKSLSEGIFPNTWKTAIIKPIFKNKGSPSNPTNYRPISLLSCMSKILEKIVFNKIYKHISEHELLTDKQSGYRPEHSTQLQLIYLTHNIYKTLDAGNEFTAIYLDISKYFDKIWHDGLLYKCERDFGLTGTLLTWLKSYLTDRTQQVQIGSSLSSLNTTNAGCPQGSVLGPLLALIYLDGLSTKTSNDTLFFADDTSLYAPHNKDNLTLTQTSLQQDLDNIQKYGQEWKITFNATKTIQQTFSLKNTPNIPRLVFNGQAIPIRDNHKHLGIHLSSDHKFKTHINETIKKVNKTLGPIYPIAKHLPRHILLQIHTTYIQPYFDYCDTVYDGLITKTDALRLERLQNRIARLITGTPLRTSTEKLREELGWATLENRRKIHKLTLFHYLLTHRTQIPSYINSILPDSRASQTGRNLRNSQTLTTAPNRIALFSNSFIPSATRLWNELPLLVRQSSSSSFKRLLHEQFSPPQPPAFFTLGTKRSNTLHTRLRLETSQLNAHLYKQKLVDSPSCPCTHPSETTEHFILHCTLYTNIRQTLFSSLSSILRQNFQSLPTSLKLKILLKGDELNRTGGQEVASCFQKFIVDSQRF